MKDIHIEGTHRSPDVYFNAEEGLIELKGVSILENPRPFYEPLVNDWLTDYLHNPQQSTTVNLMIEYFNTSSSNWIYQILKKLVDLKENDLQLSINWYYSDTDMMEIAEDYQILLNIPINMVETKD